MLRYAALPILFALAGCSEVPRTQVKSVDDVIERTPKTTFDNQFSGDAVLSGSRLTVRVEPVCSLVEMETVQTTVHYEKEAIPEDEKVWMGAIGASATAPLAGGIALLADAPNVYDSDPNSRLYNATGQEGAIAGGVALIVLGVALATPPIVNAFRYVGGESEEGRKFERAGQTLKSGITCGGVAGTPTHTLTARGSGQHFSLGNGTGSLKRVIDLKAMLPPSILDVAPAPVTLGIYANESFLAEVRVAELLEQMREERAEQDELTWRAAEPAACDAGRSEPACAGVRRYLATFPRGKHVGQANALLGRISAAPPPAPAPANGPAIAEDPAKAKLDAARKAAADAAARAAAEAEQRRLKEEEARAKKAAEDAQKAAKNACAQACLAACGNDATCRRTCQTEVCK